MKKLCSLFICICLIFCTITAPVSATTLVSAQDSAVPERVSGLLNAIGVTTPEDNVNPDGTISRGQLAVYAYRLAEGRFAGKSTRYYLDVPEGSFCYDAVSALVNLGALSIPEDQMFYPHNEVTYNEACKILMCVLDFATYAEARGGYPTGYEYVARHAELDKGVNGTQMTFKNVMQMLYNACHITLLDFNSIDDDSYIKWTMGTNTVLSYYRDIYYIKGRVDKTNTVSLIDEIPISNDMVQVNGVDVYAGLSGIEKMLGHNVEVYYYKTESGKPGTVLYYYDDTETTIIDSDDFEGYNLGVLTYVDEKSYNVKTLNIDASVPILLNGRPVKERITDAFNKTGAYAPGKALDVGQYGHIEVVEHNNKVSLVHIKRFKTMVVRYTNENQKMAWDEYRTNKYLLFDEKEYDRFHMYEAKSGTPITFNHLQKGHILTIYQSTDGEVVEIYLSDASVTGTATQIKDDEILIDGISYKRNKEMETYSRIETGVRAKFYLDANGAVCVMEPVVDVNTFAYIYDVALGDSPFSSVVKFKVFTTAGEHKILDAKLPVSVNGVRKKTVDDLVNTLAASVDSGDVATDCRQLVGLLINTKGEVINIDTAANSFESAEKKGSLVRTVEFTGTGTQYYNANGTPGFYPAPVPYKGTKVIVVPETTNFSPTEEHFRITTKDFFDKDYKYQISAYKTDTTHRYADLIVVRSETVGTIYGTDMPTMVEEVYEKLGKDGEPVKVIKGVQWGTLFEAECASDVVFYNIGNTVNSFAPYTETAIASVDDLSKGDLIRTATGSDGKVCVVQVLHDFTPNNENNPFPYWYGKGADASLKGELCQVRATFTLSAGYVVDKWVDWDRKWDTVERPPVLIDIGYNNTTDIDRTLFFSGDKVTIYDIENNRIFSGTCDDITAYNSGYGGSYLIAASVNFSQRGFYVYVYPGGR